MKNTFLGIRTCIYRVTDLNTAKGWYIQAFETQPYFDQPFYVGFNVAGYELGLQPTKQINGQDVENVLCYWGVTDVKKKFTDLIELGAVEHEPPQNVGGEILVASVRDPWNNVIGIIYNPEFKIA